MLNEKQYKRVGKTMHIAEYFYTEKIVKPILPYVSKTFVTPNMITIFNILFSFITFYLAYKEKYIAVAFLIQFYLFLDILDGNLARYKGMKSNLGARLDVICDRVFYTFIFIAIGINVVDNYIIGLVILLINLYGIIATFYIVPRLKKLKIIKRKGIKKFFMDNGFIVGMDLGTVDILMSIFLIFGKIQELYIIIIIGHAFDILFRIIELKRNERIKDNIKI